MVVENLNEIELAFQKLVSRKTNKDEPDDGLGGLGGLGMHVLADFGGCQNVPDSADVLEQIMVKAANLCKATVVNTTFHEFNPIGLSGVVVIAESHLAVHTWPEHGAICIDLFTCSHEMNPTRALEFLFENFGARTMELERVTRGRGVK